MTADRRERSPSAQEVDAMHRLLARCSCCEAWGEDPDCELHGVESDWGKSNPEPKDMVS